MRWARRTICARLHARDFFAMDTLTITSVLPGVGCHYRGEPDVSQCGAARTEL